MVKCFKPNLGFSSLSLTDYHVDLGFDSNQTSASKRRKIFCSLNFSPLGKNDWQWKCPIPAPLSLSRWIQTQRAVTKKIASIIFEQFFFIMPYCKIATMLKCNLTITRDAICQWLLQIVTNQFFDVIIAIKDKYEFICCTNHLSFFF